MWWGSLDTAGSSGLVWYLLLPFVSSGTMADFPPGRLHHLQLGQPRHWHGTASATQPIRLFQGRTRHEVASAIASSPPGVGRLGQLRPPNQRHGAASATHPFDPPSSSILPWCNASHAVKVYFHSVGIATALDLAGWFDSEEDLRSSLEEGLGASDCDSAVLAWKSAGRLSRKVVSDLSAATLPASRSCASGGPGANFDSPGLPVRLALGSASSGHVAMPAKPVEAPLGHIEREKKAPVKDRILDEIAAIYVALGPAGLHWEDVPAEQHALRQQLLLRGPRRLTVPRLGAVMRAWRDWVKWSESPHTESGLDRYRPSPVQLGLFLQQVAMKGPTVAPSRLGAFRWLRKHIGLPFPVESPCVQDFLHAPGTHVPQPARTLSPAEFWNLVALAQKLGPRKSQSVQLIILCALACIRCKHLARSSLQGINDRFLFAHCAEGKRRKLGARPPYSWAVPRPTFLGGMTFDFLGEVHERLGMPQFLLPARSRALKSFPQRRWRNVPMGYNEIVRILRAALEDAGDSKDTAATATFNTIRRFLPTAANVLRFDVQTSQAIGSWEEVPQGDGPALGKAIRPMSLHYSAELALSSGEAKMEVLNAFVSACKVHPGVLQILAGCPVRIPPQELTWQMVASRRVVGNDQKGGTNTIDQSAQVAPPPCDLGDDYRHGDRGKKRKKDTKHRRSKDKKEKKSSSTRTRRCST